MLDESGFVADSEEVRVANAIIAAFVRQARREGRDPGDLRGQQPGLRRPPVSRAAARARGGACVVPQHRRGDRSRRPALQFPTRTLPKRLTVGT